MFNKMSEIHLSVAVACFAAVCAAALLYLRPYTEVAASISWALIRESLVPILIDLLKKNQFCQVLIFGSVSASAMYFINLLYRTCILPLFSGFTSSIVIHNTDSNFDAVVDFISETMLRGHAAQSSLQAITHKKTETRRDWIQEWLGSASREPQRFDYRPDSDDTIHKLQYKGVCIYLTRTKSSDPLMGYDQPFTPESLTLTVWGRSNEILKQLMQEALNASCKQARDDCISIFTLSSSRWLTGWELAMTKRARPKESVILDQLHMDTLIDDARTFLQSGKWYVSKGIPYRRGYLLYGPPGCGKTSFVQVLAGQLQLDLCIMNLSHEGLTDNQVAEYLRDAPSNSIIVLEDIDAIFVERSRAAIMATTGAGSAGSSSGKEGRGGGGGGGNNNVTFSGLLNALDGVASQEGRLLFMTTNHIEKLDLALIRPGRCDMQVELKLASKQQMRQMFLRFFPSDPKAIKGPPLNNTTGAATNCGTGSGAGGTMVGESSASGEVGSVATADTTTASVQLAMRHAAFAEKFASRLPAYELSMATLQGHFLKHRDNAADCVKHTSDLLQSTKPTAFVKAKSIYDHLHRVGLEPYAAMLEFNGITAADELVSVNSLEHLMMMSVELRYDPTAQKLFAMLLKLSAVCASGKEDTVEDDAEYRAFLESSYALAEVSDIREQFLAAYVSFSNAPWIPVMERERHSSAMSVSDCMPTEEDGDCTAAAERHVMRQQSPHPLGSITNASPTPCAAASTSTALPDSGAVEQQVIIEAHSIQQLCKLFCNILTGSDGKGVISLYNLRRLLDAHPDRPHACVRAASAFIAPRSPADQVIKPTSLQGFLKRAGALDALQPLKQKKINTMQQLLKLAQKHNDDAGALYDELKSGSKKLKVPRRPAFRLSEILTQQTTLSGNLANFRYPTRARVLAMFKLFYSVGAQAFNAYAAQTVGLSSEESDDDDDDDDDDDTTSSSSSGSCNSSDSDGSGSDDESGDSDSDSDGGSVSDNAPRLHGGVTSSNTPTRGRSLPAPVGTNWTSSPSHCVHLSPSAPNPSPSVSPLLRLKHPSDALLGTDLQHFIVHTNPNTVSSQFDDHSRSTHSSASTSCDSSVSATATATATATELQLDELAFNFAVAVSDPQGRVLVSLLEVMDFLTSRFPSDPHRAVQCVSNQADLITARGKTEAAANAPKGCYAGASAGAGELILLGPDCRIKGDCDGGATAGGAGSAGGAAGKRKTMHAPARSHQASNTAESGATADSTVVVVPSGVMVGEDKSNASAHYNGNIKTDKMDKMAKKKKAKKRTWVHDWLESHDDCSAYACSGSPRNAGACCVTVVEGTNAEGHGTSSSSTGPGGKKGNRKREDKGRKAPPSLVRYAAAFVKEGMVCKEDFLNGPPVSDGVLQNSIRVKKLGHRRRLTYLIELLQNEHKAESAAAAAAVAAATTATAPSC